MRKTGLVWDPLFIEHIRNLGHIESPNRLAAIYHHIENDGLAADTHTVPIRPATPEDIRLIHSEAHFQRIAASAGQDFIQLDPDTWASPKSFDAAMHAAGSGIALLERILNGELDNGFLLARPPGHHAESDHTSGFCLFNNIAIAAEHLIRREGLSRVAVVDFDIHHGNGTQNAFFDRSDVLYVSSHLMPHFPGTGHIGQTGYADGVGFTVNCPLRQGMGDDEFITVYRDIVLPILNEYRPDFLLVSAGYDAHRRDPLGGTRVSTEAFAAVSKMMIDAADRCCGGRTAFFLEGGYDLPALVESVEASLRALLGLLGEEEDRYGQSRKDRVPEYFEHLRKNHAAFWNCLRSPEDAPKDPT